jgi:hypothetical protein
VLFRRHAAFAVRRSSTAAKFDVAVARIQALFAQIVAVLLVFVNWQNYRRNRGQQSR